jgi:arginyl-tRNA--protein-N-Asp/Glu arginylyltransferase
MNNEIHLFQTTPVTCPYLHNRSSCNHIIDPDYPLSPKKYDLLLGMGFRRSAGIVYRPACDGCSECKSCRVPVSSFQPNRSQIRAWKKIQNESTCLETPAEFNPEHFELYRQYTRTRHQDSDMKDSSEDQYMEFLTSKWSQTLFLELRYDDKLFAVAVTDQQPRSLSALYTFFNPDFTQLSPGVVAILCQIDLAKKLELDWLYLGYWIKDCQKMRYKTQYRPIQIFDEGHWKYLKSV